MAEETLTAATFATSALASSAYAASSFAVTRGGLMTTDIQQGLPPQARWHDRQSPSRPFRLDSHRRWEGFVEVGLVSRRLDRFWWLIACRRHWLGLHLNTLAGSLKPCDILFGSKFARFIDPVRRLWWR